MMPIQTSSTSQLRTRDVEDMDELGEDVFVEYNKDGEIIGIEIWQTRRYVIPKILRFIKAENGRMMALVEFDPEVNVMLYQAERSFGVRAISSSRPYLHNSLSLLLELNLSLLLTLETFPNLGVSNVT